MGRASGGFAKTRSCSCAGVRICHDGIGVSLAYDPVMKRSLALCVGVGLWLMAGAGEAQACGGGVTTDVGTLAVDVQRAFFSVGGGSTDVVVQIRVPSADADYGIILPVPDQPTLDSTPVDSAELSSLEHQTRPALYLGGGGGGSCIGCAAAGADNEKGTLDVSDPVDIGPVTAVIINASDSSELTTWLNANGFVVPTSFQLIVDGYIGGSGYFIAFKRNDTAPPSGETSVGIHYTVPGETLGYPLRIAAMGAGPELAVTVFIAASEGVAASTPFTTLTLDDIDATTVDNDGYGAALQTAVAAESNRAFVIEGVFSMTELSLGPTLSSLTDSSQVITRLSSVFDTNSMDVDVLFNDAAPQNVPREIIVRAGDPPTAPVFMLALVGLLATSAIRRRVF